MDLSRVGSISPNSNSDDSMFDPFFDIFFGTELRESPRPSSKAVLACADLFHQYPLNILCNKGRPHTILDLYKFPVTKKLMFRGREDPCCIFGARHEALAPSTMPSDGSNWILPGIVRRSGRGYDSPPPDSIKTFMADRRKTLQLCMQDVGIFRHLELLEDNFFTNYQQKEKPDIFKKILQIRKFIENIEMYFNAVNAYDWQKAFSIIRELTFEANNWIFAFEMTNFSALYELLCFYHREAERMMHLQKKNLLSKNPIQQFPSNPPKKLKRSKSCP